MKPQDTYRFKTHADGEAFLQSMVRGEPLWDLVIKPYVSDGPNAVKVNPDWLAAPFEWSVVRSVN